MISTNYTIHVPWSWNCSRRSAGVLDALEDEEDSRLVKTGFVLWFVTGTLFVLLLGLMAFKLLAPQPLPSEFIEVRVKGVTRDPSTDQPVAILRDVGGDRAMPIWIGEAEAHALEAARRKITYHRPLTHDLLVGILDKLEARPMEVRITQVRDNIFYALVLLDIQPEPLEIDARPSDAMVLALRAGCPIMVATPVFESRSASLHPVLHTQYGVDVQELTENLKRAFGFPGEGVLVSQVKGGSQAAHDGLIRGDILVQIAGTPIRHVEDLEKAISGATGDLTARVYRGGRFHSMTLHP